MRFVLVKARGLCNPENEAEMKLKNIADHRRYRNPVLCIAIKNRLLSRKARPLVLLTRIFSAGQAITK